MAKTEVQTRDIKDGEVRREDVNVNTSGEALIRKLLNGAGIVMSQDGADAGTGDVTIRLKDRLTLDFTFNGQTTNTWLRINDAGIPSHQSALMFDKTYYVRKIFFGHRNVGDGTQVCRIRARRTPDTDTGNVATGDPLAWEVLSSDSNVIKNVGGAKNWIWIAPDESLTLEPGFRYGFRVERPTGTVQWNDVHCIIELEEVIP